MISDSSRDNAMRILMRSLPKVACPKCGKPGVVGLPFQMLSGQLVQCVLHATESERLDIPTMHHSCFVMLEDGT